MKADPLILQMKYTDIVSLFARQNNLSLDEALKIFYESKLYQLMREGVADIHCMSVPYLAEDLRREYKAQRHL